jgi:integrase
MITKLGLRMVLLTLARTTEIRYATWGEFELDSDSAVWRIPGERMKMERDHMVPLSGPPPKKWSTC